MSKPRRRLAAGSWLARLAEVYADVDALFAGSACPASTECCRFAVTRRQPHVTSVELLAVERAIARRGGALSQARRARPLGPRDRPEAICPLLTDTGRCAVYDARPLGCRTFWCERASRPGRVPHHEVLALVRRVQDIAADHRHDGDRGRPLLAALANPHR